MNNTVIDTRFLHRRRGIGGISIRNSTRKGAGRNFFDIRSGFIPYIQRHKCTWVGQYRSLWGSNHSRYWIRPIINNINTIGFIHGINGIQQITSVTITCSQQIKGYFIVTDTLSSIRKGGTWTTSLLSLLYLSDWRSAILLGWRVVVALWNKLIFIRRF